MASYVRFDPGLTKVPDGEAEDVQAIQSMFTALINGDFEKHGKRDKQPWCGRILTKKTVGHSYPVTHAKTLGLVKGKLVVPENLPEHLRQSMFSKGGEYPVLMRYSTNHHDVGTEVSDLPMTVYRDLLICKRITRRRQGQQQSRYLMSMEIDSLRGQVTEPRILSSTHRCK